MFESNNVRIPRPTPRSARRATTTKWGDREQRRIDILDAARERITDSGYLSLNMRDLAAAAGISPATLYSYFATKEELFATLYAGAIREHTETFRPIADAGLSLDDLLVKAIEHHLKLYTVYSRHFPLWSELRMPDSFPKELILELRTVTKEHNVLLMQSIRDAAEREGAKIVDERLVPSFLWSVLNGLADHFTSERRALDKFPAKKLITFSAQRLAVAITA